MQSRIAEAVREFERGGVKALESWASAREVTGRDLDDWVSEVADERASVAVTWLLRAWLARGVELSRRQTAALLRSLDRVPAEAARLHLCQLVGDLDVPARNAEQLARFLRSGIEGQHKFIRAWAVDGMVRLARQHEHYRNEALWALARAERDPAASVRARARRIAKELARSS